MVVTAAAKESPSLPQLFPGILYARAFLDRYFCTTHITCICDVDVTVRYFNLHFIPLPLIEVDKTGGLPIPNEKHIFLKLNHPGMIGMSLLARSSRERGTPRLQRRAELDLAMMPATYHRTHKISRDGDCHLAMG
jgi:hypothetical protein